MKAFLLSAGYGTRLKPLTNEIPKCLIPINGQPLLDIWLEILEKEGVEEVLINTHYMAEAVKDFMMKRKSNIRIILTYEENLLGSGGTLLTNKNFVKGEENFYLLYADNLTNVKLKPLLDLHLSRNSIFTTYVYKTAIPKQKGIFVANPETGKVYDFCEKPENPKSDLANAGIGVLNIEIFNYFDERRTFYDFGSDIMSKIVKDMYILETDKYIKDIGTLEDYYSAQKEWKLIKNYDNYPDSIKD